MRNISNSEVTTWLTCRRQYKYAFWLNLEPKRMSQPLYRGNVGHLCFQRYIEARIDGSNHDSAMNAGKQVFVEAMKADGSRMSEILELKMVWERYMNFHQGWPQWELYLPEQKYEVELTPEIKMVIRYDAKIREKRTGHIKIGDWKFHYDFLNRDLHALNGQMPKYLAVMDTTGENVQAGFLEEIRTRPLGKEKASDPKYTWHRTDYYPTLAKKKNMLRQHIKASLEIERYRALPDNERELESIPVLNKLVCKFCNFIDLCNAENDGKKDLSADIAVGYQPNTYGYNFEEPDIMEAL